MSMIAYAQARSILIEAGEAAFKRAKPEFVALEHSVGRIICQEVTSPSDSPSFDNSAMDGFAVASAWTCEASHEKPLRLPVEGCVVAGGQGAGSQDTGRALEIMTGAPSPSWADAVVKIEEVQVERDSNGNALAITLKKPLKPGENLRRRGQDMQVGQHLLKPGTRLRAEYVMALATLGLAKLPVARQVRVSVISTGKEIAPFETAELPHGMIRNSSAPYLMTALRGLGAEPRYHGIIPDDEKQFARVLDAACLDGADVVISTGAVSMGKHDFIADTLERKGAKIIFHKAAIRPGKPVLFATLPNGSVFFGLPGNPVSTAVGLRFFVQPLLRAWSGEAPEKPVRASLLEAVSKPDGLRCFFKARLSADHGEIKVQVLPGQASFMVAPLLETNAWAELPEAGASLDAGTGIDVWPLLPEAFQIASGACQVASQGTGGCC